MNGLADRGLSAVEFFGGARETAFAGYGEEDFELREFQGRAFQLNIIAIRQAYFSSVSTDTVIIISFASGAEIA